MTTPNTKLNDEKLKGSTKELSEYRPAVLESFQTTNKGSNQFAVVLLEYMDDNDIPHTPDKYWTKNKAGNYPSEPFQNEHDCQLLREFRTACKQWCETAGYKWGSISSMVCKTFTGMNLREKAPGQGRPKGSKGKGNAETAEGVDTTGVSVLDASEIAFRCFASILKHTGVSEKNAVAHLCFELAVIGRAFSVNASKVNELLAERSITPIETKPKAEKPVKAPKAKNIVPSGIVPKAEAIAETVPAVKAA